MNSQFKARNSTCTTTTRQRFRSATHITTDPSKRPPARTHSATTARKKTPHGNASLHRSSQGYRTRLRDFSGGWNEGCIFQPGRERERVSALSIRWDSNCAYYTGRNGICIYTHGRRVAWLGLKVSRRRNPIKSVLSNVQLSRLI